MGGEVSLFTVVLHSIHIKTMCQALHTTFGFYQSTSGFMRVCV